MENQKFIETSLKRHPSPDLCKRKYLFQKASHISNVLPYYAVMRGSDILMSKFSTVSRRIWKEDLKIWKTLPERNLEEITINPGNIDHFTKFPRPNNYVLKFKVMELQSVKWVTKILTLIESTPNPKQIIKIQLLYRPGYAEDSYSKVYIPDFLKVLDKLHQEIGNSCSLRIIPNNRNQLFYLYFSDMVCFEPGLETSKVQLKILAKVKDTDKVICIASKFRVDNKKILLCTDNINQFPGIIHMELNDPLIPVFENVKDIEFKRISFSHLDSEEDFNRLVKKCYPNLEKLKFELTPNWDPNPMGRLCEMVKDLKITTIFQDPPNQKCYIEASDVLIIKLSKRDPPKYYKCDIKAYLCSFTIHSVNSIDPTHVTTFNFYPKSLSNCTLTSPTSCHPLPRFTSLIIPFAHISHLTFRLPSLSKTPSSSPVLPASDLFHFHHLLSPTCSLMFTHLFLSKYNFKKSLLTRIQAKAWILVIMDTGICTEFDMWKTKIGGYSQVDVSLMEAREYGEEDVQGRVELLERLGRLRNLRRVYLERKGWGLGREVVRRVVLPPSVEVVYEEF